jgi:radical SAM/Cys-rich protein
LEQTPRNSTKHITKTENISGDKMKKMANEVEKYAFDKKIAFKKLETLQVNLGNICNNHCKHCHMNAGPNGKNLMSVKIIDDVVEFLEKNPSVTLDITGGSPEMHPAIRYFIKTAAEKTKKTMLRTNLTILAENSYTDMPELFKENKVALLASLPCYTKQNVEAQRGMGTFDTSIEVLKKLNELGYAREKDLKLDLVYNPLGDYLPAPQKQLENDYKKHLKENYKIVFGNLLTIL